MGSISEALQKHADKFQDSYTVTWVGSGHGCRDRYERWSRPYVAPTPSPASAPASADSLPVKPGHRQPRGIRLR